MSLKHSYTESSLINLKKIKERVLYSDKTIDNLAEMLANIISNLKGATLIVATGGSVVVAEFLKKVLERYNIICEVIEPRTFNYKENIASFENLFCISYSGRTNGISNALEKFRGNKYLITGSNKVEDSKTVLLQYNMVDKEKSFVSLATTLIPMSLFLKSNEIINGTYKSEEMHEFLDYCFENSKYYENYPLNFQGLNIEIMSGYDTSCAAKTLESNLVETGTTSAVVHDKGSFCHGRSNLINNNPTNALIYLEHQKKDLDYLLLDLLKKEYKNIIELSSTEKYQDILRKEFLLNLNSIYLSKKIASDNNIDLCMVEYNPKVINKIYSYRGEM